MNPAVVTIGFDDGRETQANAGAILADYGFAGTFYVTSGGNGSTFGLDNPGFMTQDQVRILELQGHEIGGHTRSHPNLASLDTVPPAVPMAVNAFESVTSAPNRYVPVSDLQDWVRSAQDSADQKWVNLYWHDVVDAQHPGWGVTGLGDGAPGYEGSVAAFKTFLYWLQGEVTAGRAIVKTAGEVCGAEPVQPKNQPSGAIGELWTAKGGYTSFLGTPLNSEYSVPGVSGARMEDFEDGQIY